MKVIKKLLESQNIGLFGLLAEKSINCLLIKTSLKLATNYLVNNSFFTLGSLCFRQLIGMAIGSEKSPFMAKLNSVLLWKEVQKQPLRGVPRKRCSENMQEIYRRTPMPNCDFNKVALQLY